MDGILRLVHSSALCMLRFDQKHRTDEPGPRPCFPALHAYDAYYKTTRTSRGLTYRYLHVPAAGKDVTLLWLHGFPSSVYDWHHQLEYFRAKGYGLLAPDMLGYGGSDKPADAAQYKKSLMARDIIDVLDAEVAGARVVAIAHDWGAGLLGRIADLYHERFAGLAFFSVGYLGPNPHAPYTLDETLPLYKKIFGKEVFAYWELFTKPSADKICADNFDSFLDMLYAADSFNLWSNIMMVRHEPEKFVEGGKRVPRATFISDEDYAAMREHLIGPGRGLKGPLNWYSSNTEGHNSADDKELVQQLGDKLPLKLSQPVFFGATHKDAVCHPSRMQPTFNNVAADLTVVDFDTSHWVFLEQPEKVNVELEKWLEAKVLKA